jgi:hypothetical protein
MAMQKLSREERFMAIGPADLQSVAGQVNAVFRWPDVAGDIRGTMKLLGRRGVDALWRKTGIPEPYKRKGGAERVDDQFVVIFRARD